MFKISALPILLGLAASACADEGQWQPHPLPQLQPGDAIQLASYPGRRYTLPAEIRFAREVDYPGRVASLTADLSVIAAATMGKPDCDVRYASVVKSLNNALKKTQGLLDGYARKDVAAIE